GHAGNAASHLRLHAVCAPEGSPADEPVHDDLPVRTGSRADHPGAEFLPVDAPRTDRGAEPLAIQYSGVADFIASAPRELRSHPDRLSGAVRVQRSGTRRRSLAAE